MIEMEIFREKCLTVSIPKKSKRKLQCVKYEDTHYCILDARLNDLFGLQLQIWEKAGKSLSFQRNAFINEVKNFQQTDSPGRQAIRNTITIAGQFPCWEGSGVQDKTHNGLFTDMNWICESDELVLFTRLTLKEELEQTIRTTELILSSLKVLPLMAWVL